MAYNASVDGNGFRYVGQFIVFDDDTFEFNGDAPMNDSGDTLRSDSGDTLRSDSGEDDDDIDFMRLYDGRRLIFNNYDSSIFCMGHIPAHNRDYSYLWEDATLYKTRPHKRGRVEKRLMRHTKSLKRERHRKDKKYKNFKYNSTKRHR